MRLSKNEEVKLNSADRKEKERYRTEATEKILNSSHTKQLILSGAGTGKTTIFNRKINEVWIKNGIAPEKIIVSSFINFIVSDLKKELHQDCNVYTLHKLAKIIVHRFLDANGLFKNPITSEFQVALEADEDNIAEDISWLENKPEITDLEISIDLENYFFSPFKSTPSPFLDKYFSLCTFYDVVSFDDIVLRAIQAISENENVFPREKVIVDEYQDFNDLEQAFVSKLFEDSLGGIIAGDDDQSIYSTKNANPGGIINIYKDDTWENNNLPFCSRCKSAAIVECASSVCRRQGRADRIDKSFLPFEDNSEKVKIVTLSKSSSTNRDKFFIEAEYIAKQIDMERIQSWQGKYPAYLILGMKNSHLKKVAEILKERLGVEIGMKQPDPYKDTAVQTLYSYIQLLKNPATNLAYRRLLGLTSRRDKKEITLKAINAGGFAKLDDAFITEIESQLEKLRPIVKSAKIIEEKLSEIVSKLGLNPANENLVKFIDSIKGRGDISQILKEVDDLAIEQKEQERASITATPIQCLTIWGSKGLKADIVFVLGLEEGYLPKNNSTPTDEEIRLLYVAITRAVEKLYLLRCKVRWDGVHGGNNGMKNPSVFLNWLPNEFIEILPDIKKADLT